MPWFQFLPNVDERDYWKVGALTIPKLGMWPSPNSNRVHAGFRLEEDPDLIPYTSRYVIEYKGWKDSPAVGDPEVHRMFWVDLDVVTAGQHLAGNAGVDPETLYDADVSIKQYNTLPVAQTEGREIRVELEHSQGASAVMTLEYQDVGGTRLHWDRNWFQSSAIAAIDFGSTEWPQEVNRFEWYPVPECYTFPPQSPILPEEGFAEFNGIDSYISLSENVVGFAQPFRVTCEFRIRGQPDWMPIWGREADGGFFGKDQTDAIFGFLRLNTSWTADTDVWHTYRYDFEQAGQLGHQEYIDGINVMDRTTNRQFSQFNNLGVYRRTLPGVIWGHFDLRRLKYQRGTVGDFETHLDMPLLQNALDLSDNENHGTTFNMDLPSI